MAPSTRLQSGAIKRTSYANSRTTDNLRNKIPAPLNTLVAPPASAIEKAPTRAKAVKKECAICATPKTMGFFIPSTNVEVCEHMQDVCKLCVGKMIKAKVSEWDLGEAVLACPFSECSAAIGFGDVKKIIGKEYWATWDNALIQNLLTSSPNFITCLSPECGQYFSIENDAPECETRKELTCPTCNYKFCASCNRAWHDGEDCDQAILREENATQQQLEDMGTKPCPSCGIRIQKNGGCNHVKCCQCGHGFCWVCLVAYSPEMEHAADCPDRVRIGANPGDFAVGDITIEELEQIAWLLVGPPPVFLP